MIPTFRYLKISVLFSIFITLLPAAERILWPTEEDPIAAGLDDSAFLQATASGDYRSGGFGCVRSGGYQFHEGIDIKASKRSRRGDALDEVRSVYPGRIVRINKIGGNSSYGKYVVIIHEKLDPAVYTLYAHFSHVHPNIREGQIVEAGTPLGIMGNTAGGYKIPKDRSHLHFEIGLMMNDKFQHWYKTQHYTSPNHHGIWNGINLVGFDPLDFYRKYYHNRVSGIKEYLASQPTALTVRVHKATIPDFVRRYPSLLTKPIPSNLKGWLVEFTWYGLPVRWTPLTSLPSVTRSIHSIYFIESYDKALLEANRGKKILNFKRPEKPQFREGFLRELSLLFL